MKISSYRPVDGKAARRVEPLTLVRLEKGGSVTVGLGVNLISAGYAADVIVLEGEFLEILIPLSSVPKIGMAGMFFSVLVKGGEREAHS